MNGIWIKEIRNSTGLSQNDFAKQYDIPLSTLRKWEQDVTRPPEYIFKMFNIIFPEVNKDLIRIEGPDNKIFFINSNTNEVLDTKGNRIMTKSDFKPVNKHNLGIYLNEIFEDYYTLQEKLERDCRLDPIEGIIW